jgi:hypothetical protein
MSETTVYDYVRGPIIVKVHGSPLEVFPADNKVSERKDGEAVEYRRMQHSLVLSESRYLLSLIGESSYPSWVVQELRRPNRHLWFFGYSLTDWNARLHLFEGFRYLGDEQGRTKQSRTVLGSSFDILRGAILSSLNMEHFHGDLVAFGEYLSRVQSISDILSGACRRAQR